MIGSPATELVAMILFIVYATLDQWAFRCQRVGRGILLLALDTAAGQPDLFGRIMPPQFVAAMWIKRLVWLACAYFAWTAWGWWALLPLLLYGLVLGVFVDGISPWPSYLKVLDRFKHRISSGRAGMDAWIALSPTISHIEEQMAVGAHFEEITTGAWIKRASDAAARMSADPETEDLR